MLSPSWHVRQTTEESSETRVETQVDLRLDENRRLSADHHHLHHQQQL